MKMLIAHFNLPGTCCRGCLLAGPPLCNALEAGRQLHIASSAEAAQKQSHSPAFAVGRVPQQVARHLLIFGENTVYRNIKSRSINSDQSVSLRVYV
jgi:hypothetical protein